MGRVLLERYIKTNLKNRMGKCKMNVMNLDVFRQSFMVAMVNCRLNKDEILLPAEYISVHAGGRSTVLTAHDVQGAVMSSHFVHSFFHI
jgi:hypothetical protein